MTRVLLFWSEIFVLDEVKILLRKARHGGESGLNCDQIIGVVMKMLNIDGYHCYINILEINKRSESEKNLKFYLVYM